VLSARQVVIPAVISWRCVHTPHAALSAWLRGPYWLSSTGVATVVWGHSRVTCWLHGHFLFFPSSSSAVSPSVSPVLSTASNTCNRLRIVGRLIQVRGGRTLCCCAAACVACFDGEQRGCEQWTIPVSFASPRASSSDIRRSRIALTSRSFIDSRLRVSPPTAAADLPSPARGATRGRVFGLFAAGSKGGCCLVLKTTNVKHEGCEPHAPESRVPPPPPPARLASIFARRLQEPHSAI
jgi:hypothetical protein